MGRRQRRLGGRFWLFFPSFLPVLAHACAHTCTHTPAAGLREEEEQRGPGCVLWCGGERSLGCVRACVWLPRGADVLISGSCRPRPAPRLHPRAPCHVQEQPLGLWVCRVCAPRDWEASRGCTGSTSREGTSCPTWELPCSDATPAPREGPWANEESCSSFPGPALAGFLATRTSPRGTEGLTRASSPSRPLLSCCMGAT